MSLHDCATEHPAVPDSEAPTSAAIWQPIALAGRQLSNRLAVAPMSRVSTRGDGVPTAAMVHYYRRYAGGGFGSVITEGIYPIGPGSQGYPNQPGLVTAEQVQAWAAVTSAVHGEGGLVVAQIMHAGALSQHLRATVGPSAVTPRGEMMPEYGGAGAYPTPVALTADLIDDVVDGFAATAALAVDAGFDGIEIHAANGYLLDQFLTPYTNLRTDRYGGSASARAQLTADIVRAVTSRTRGKVLVGVRLSQAKVNDSHHRWHNADEASEIFGTIAAAHPTYLHLAGEGRPWTESGRAADGTPLGELARRLTGLPVMVNGALHGIELIERVLRSGEADLVSIGRPALADPDWAHRIRQGQTPRPFDHGMITPAATVETTEAFLQRSASDGSPRP
jgi:2,4-dienoyl-CoA reductase-like NADH-dependent reductase (Old Yellow Enzyme family)